MGPLGCVAESALFTDIKSATFDVLAAGSLHGHVHVRACTFDPGGVPPVRMCLRAYGLPPDLGLWLATTRAVCTLLRFMGFSGPRQCNEAAVLHVGRRLHVAPIVVCCPRALAVNPRVC